MLCSRTKIKTRIACKQMDELNEIERAIKSTLVHTSPMGEAWFEEHWKPKFDKVRSLMVECDLYHCPICNSTTGCKECLCCGQEKSE